MGDLTAVAALTEVGKQIQRYRIMKEMSQAELCAASGVSIATLSRLETGQGNPRLESLVQVLRALGLLDAFLQLVTPPEISPIAMAAHATARKSGVSRVLVAGPTRKRVFKSAPAARRAPEWKK